LINTSDGVIAAISLKNHFQIPLIVTIHATEYGRYNGLYNDTNRYIAGKESILIENGWQLESSSPDEALR
jgi:hypothetical protein